MSNVIGSQDILVWSDGFWCYRDELCEMYYRSDDYYVIYENTQEYEQFMRTHHAE